MYFDHIDEQNISPTNKALNGFLLSLAFPQGDQGNIEQAGSTDFEILQDAHYNKH
jgi:hypothetical protein